MSGNNEVIFADRDGRPQLWIRRYRGRTFINTRLASHAVKSDDEVIKFIKDYLSSISEPSFDSALYYMAARNKLKKQYTHKPLFNLIGEPGKIDLLVFPDLSIYDGNDFYESINELCVELKYNHSYRKRLQSITPVEPLSPYSDAISAMSLAIRKLRQVHIEMP